MDIKINVCKLNIGFSLFYSCVKKYMKLAKCKQRQGQTLNIHMVKCSSCVIFFKCFLNLTSITALNNPRLLI